MGVAQEARATSHVRLLPMRIPQLGGRGLSVVGGFSIIESESDIIPLHATLKLLEAMHEGEVPVLALYW
jgi:hypothetical protein